MKHLTSSTVTVAAICCFMLASAKAATPDIEQIWKIVQAQQLRIEQLETSLAASTGQLEAAKAQLVADAIAQGSRIEQTELALENTVAAVETAVFDRGESDTTIGGYGELHYNDLDNGEEIDLHRFVMLFSHRFSDTVKVYSELEVEHSLAGEGKPGEVEVEQAYVHWDYATNHHAKLGLFLMPVGIINETHEPDTFFGVERNSVEKNIIPATWWEAGVGLSGEIAPGWGYDLAMHSGLNLDTDNTSASRRSSIRSSRQKVAKANGDSFAYTARLRYAAYAGIQWNATLQYQPDLTQGDADNIGIEDISAMLFETNVTYQNGGFGLRALYANWDIDDEIEILNSGADEQTGWYLEPSYTFENGLGLFARYGAYDLTAGSSVASDERKQFDLGVNYWIHENVVIKADYQRQDNDNGTDIDGFNLGVGYSF
ncbi:MAG: opacity protein-like surface antigen [Candidatus Azotimanducaceae bacterium]|jgi:opacity protein-like surface antigen